MNTPTRVGAYLLALAVAFGLAFGVGRMVGPLDVVPDSHETTHEGAPDPGDGHEHSH